MASGVAVAVAEGWIGDDSEPFLADGSGAEEVRGLLRRDAEEDLCKGVLNQLRWRHVVVELKGSRNAVFV